MSPATNLFDSNRTKKMTSERKPANPLKAFLKLESAGGLILLGAALLAMIAENLSITKALHYSLLSTPVIASLAFEHGGPDYTVDDRLGIITGTLLSAFAGYFVLRFASRRSSVRAGSQT